MNRILDLLGPDHPAALTTRSHIAHWTGMTGEGRAALRLHQDLLRDEERVLGRDHRDTLTTRGNVAHWTNPEVGGYRDAAATCPWSCCRTKSGCWVRDHRDTLLTRNGIARALHRRSGQVS